MEEQFKIYVDDFFIRNPQLKDRIRFMGQIDDKKALYMEYVKSKVFVLPSKFENFSIATVEALMNGCYLILSDQVTPKVDFTDNWKYGCEVKVNDVDDWADKMLKVSQMNIDERIADDIAEYTRKKYLWENICDSLYSEIVK